MGWPKIIYDFLSHLTDSNAHNATNMSKPNTLIKSNEDGHINKSLFESPLTFKKFKSSGITKTGYLLADDKDLIDIFNTIDSVVITTSGDTSSDAVVDNLTVVIENRQLKSNINKTVLTYCTHCTHCQKLHCTYCTYCTYCNCYCSDCQCN